MSSPNLNNIILIGTSLVYASVVFYGIDRNLVDAEIFILSCHVGINFKSVKYNEQLYPQKSESTRRNVTGDQTK